jgi:hypothetical protein
MADDGNLSGQFAVRSIPTQPLPIRLGVEKSYAFGRRPLQVAEIDCVLENWLVRRSQLERPRAVRSEAVVPKTQVRAAADTLDPAVSELEILHLP